MLNARLPTISVSKGGTGRTSLTSGYFLRGNGTNSVTLSSIDQVKSALGISESINSLQVKTFTSYSAIRSYETSDYVSGSSGLRIYNITNLGFMPYLVLSQSFVKTSYSTWATTTIHLRGNSFVHSLGHQESSSVDVFTGSGEVEYGYIDQSSIWGTSSVKTAFYASSLNMTSFCAIIIGL